MMSTCRPKIMINLDVFNTRWKFSSYNMLVKPVTAVCNMEAAEAPQTSVE
jgi:hypothetical protein